MGHYLSDLLPDPNIVCLICMKGIWPKETVQAWSGYLTSCKCAFPDPCDPNDVNVINTPNGRKWVKGKS